MFRVVRPHVPALLVAGLVVAVAACGSSAGSPSPSEVPSTKPAPSASAPASPTPSPSPAAATPGLLLEVTSEGGFINPAATIGALPRLVIDIDGRIYTPALPADGSTTPLVPAVSVRDVGAAGAAQILAAIRTSGLDVESSGGVLADAGATVFTVMIDGTQVVSRFAAGAGGPVTHGGGSPGDSGAPGASAFALLAQLEDPTVTWGGAAADPTTYRPVAYRVWVAPGAPADQGNGGSPVAWPLATDLAGFGSPAAADFGVMGLRSGIVTGTDAATLAAALATAGPSTTVTSGGKPYMLWVRGLFPDELGS